MICLTKYDVIKLKCTYDRYRMLNSVSFLREGYLILGGGGGRRGITGFQEECPPPLSLPPETINDWSLRLHCYAPYL